MEYSKDLPKGFTALSQYAEDGGPPLGQNAEDVTGTMLCYSGIQTGPDARFYSIYSEMAEAFNNEGKPLVLQVRFPSRSCCFDCCPRQ